MFLKIRAKCPPRQSPNDPEKLLRKHMKPCSQLSMRNPESIPQSDFDAHTPQVSDSYIFSLLCTLLSVMSMFLSSLHIVCTLHSLAPYYMLFTSTCYSCLSTEHFLLCHSLNLSHSLSLSLSLSLFLFLDTSGPACPSQLVLEQATKELDFLHHTLYTLLSAPFLFTHYHPHLSTLSIAFSAIHCPP